MRGERLRRVHVMLGVVASLQLLPWVLSGIYFAFSSIEEVRGEHLEVSRPVFDIDANTVLPLADALAATQGTEIVGASIEIVRGAWSWVLEGADGTIHYVGEDGLPLQTMSRAHAEEYLAKDLGVDVQGARYSYLSQPVEAERFTYRGGRLPAWRVDLADDAGTSVYINAMTGKVERIRTTSWRWFNFMFMLHSMDYEDRSDFQNPLLRSLAITSLLVVVTGLVLSYRVRRRRDASA